MVELGHNVIVVCPTNKLIQNYEAANDKLTSATINKIFNTKMGDLKIKSFDCSEYKVCVFDETYCDAMHIRNRNKNTLILIKINYL